MASQSVTARATAFHILLMAIPVCLTNCVAAHAEEVNLSLYVQRAIPTASDSIDDNYNNLAGAFADGKKESAWVTARTMQEHWAHIEWRNVAVTVNRVEMDFSPVTQVYNPPQMFGEKQAPPTVNVTTVKPESLELEVHTQGKWQTIQSFAQPIQWQADGNSVVIIPVQPLTQVKEVRLKLKNKAPTDLFAVHELSIWGPKTETSFPMRPKWKGYWLWGEPEPNMANFGLVKRYLRRVFEVKDPAEIQSARLMFVVHDRGRAWLNGTEIARTAHPGRGMRRELARRDVDPALFKKGKNLLAFLGEDVDEVGLRGILAELCIEKKDGTRECLTTEAPAFQASSFDEPGWNTSMEGFDHWQKATALGGPNHDVEWGWSMDYTPAYFAGKIGVTGVTLDPKVPKPGDSFKLSVQVKVAAPLDDIFGMTVKYGESGATNPMYMDFNLGEGFLRPELCLPKGFQGEKTLILSDVWTKGTPPRLPLVIRFCNAEKQLEVIAGPVGEVTADEQPGRLKVYVGQPPVQYKKKGFPEVKVAQGGRLTVDGVPTAPIIYTSSLQTPDRYQEYLKSGIKIFRIVPGGAACVVPAEGDEELTYSRLLKSISTQVEAIHAMDRDARFLLYLDLDMPNAWKFEHPEELITLGNNQRLIPLDAANQSTGYMNETPNSPAVLRKIREALTTFIRRLEQQPYSRSILGFSFAHGRAGENYWGVDTNMSLDDDGKWIIPDRSKYVFGDFGVAARRNLRDWLKEKYKTKDALAKSWKVDNMDFEDVVSSYKWPTREFVENLMWRKKGKDQFMFRDQIAEGSLYYDFVRHQNEARTQLFVEACKTVKEITGGRLLAGGYIGYVVPMLTNSPPAIAQESGHAALRMVLDCPYIDYIFSPHYYHMRRAGDPVMPLSVAESLRLHGKLYLNEYDARSYLSPISPKTFSQKETLEVFQKEFGNAVTRDQGWWWYEFPFALVGKDAPAWFADPLMIRDASVMKRVYDKYLSLPYPGVSAEVAVFLNVEEAYHADCYSPANTVHSDICNFLIPRLSMLGAPFDLYTQSDLPLMIRKGWHKNYKLILFLNAFHLSKEERALINDNLKKDGRTLLFFFAPGFQGNELPDTELSLSGIEEVTGMKGVHKLDELHLPGLTLDSQQPLTKDIKDRDFDAIAWWGYEQIDNYHNEIAPIFYLTPGEANGWDSLASIRLDKKTDTSKTALALLKQTDHTIAYSVVPDLPASVLCSLASAAGVHVYSRPGVFTWANPYLLCVHAGREAKQVALKARDKVTWVEPFEKKVYGKNAQTITVDLAEGETKFFCLEKGSEWEELLRE